MNTILKQVSAAIIIKDGKVLIAKRAAGYRLAGKWEFPGGKVEDGESPEECLKRELAEELGIVVSVGDFFARSVYCYEHGAIELLVYFADWISGDMRLSEHDEVKWAAVADLGLFDFSPADIPVVEKLRMKFSTGSTS
ncbi:MAG: 8-oxo-dGTP diphosphatase MutT [Firmicutes bacterium]|nr:8-oxo-dGTP diphosphatase MutT [Bacillota bacterium]